MNTLFRLSGRLAGYSLAVLLLLGANVQAQQLQPIDRIAAVVDEDVILQSELDRAVRNITAQYAGREAQLPPGDVLRRQVLERLVLTKLQVARAESSGIRASDEEVDAAIGRIAAQNQIDLDQLRTQLARDGQSFAEFRTSIREELLMQRLRQSFAQSRISVSEAEVESALSAQAGGSVQYRLANLLVALPDGATPEQIATGQSKINGVKALIDKGEMDFAAAAARYSDGPNALEGGDLGWRSLDEIPPAFAATIREMQTGQVIGPVRGSSGFQLLKLVEVRDAAAQAGATTVTEFNARHILIRIDADTDDSQARGRIDAIAARIAGGADFATVAKESSEDENNNKQGGELGWFAQDAFGPAFGAQVAALSDGGVSAPFKSDAGWHILQRTASRQVAATGDQSRRTQVRETIGRRKLEDEYNRFLREMRGEAFVELRTQPAAAPAAEATPPQAPADGG
jgi:peptidyl-prolyl cis-trans isomerase SurA